MSDTIAPGPFTVTGSYKGPDGADPLAEHITRGAVVLDPKDWPTNSALPPVQQNPVFSEDNGDIIADAGGVEANKDDEIAGFLWEVGPNDGSKPVKWVTIPKAEGPTINLTEVDEDFGDNWFTCARTYIDQTSSLQKCRTFHETTPGTAPDAPTNVSVTNVSSAQQSVDATIDTAADTTRIDRQKDGGSFVTVAEGLVAADFPWPSTGLEASTPYCYRLQSTNIVDDSDFSATECETTPAPTQGGENEPVGHTLWTEHFANSTTEDGWGVLSPNWPFTVEDATAPIDPPTVIRYRYPAGSQDGSSHGNKMWSPTVTARLGTTPREVYLRTVIKYSPNWVNQTTGTKLLYLKRRQHAGGPAFLIARSPTREGDMRMHVWLQNQETMSGCSNPGTNIGPNLSNVFLTRGLWHDIEVYMKLNTFSDTACDGILRMWVNGTQTHDYANVHYGPLDDGAGEGSWYFDVIDYNAVYGGNVGETIPEAQNIDIAYIYASVK